MIEIVAEKGKCIVEGRANILISGRFKANRSIKASALAVDVCGNKVI